MLEAGPLRKDALVASASLLAIAAVLLAQPLVGGRASAATATTAGGQVTLATKTFHLTRPNDNQRLVVRCPGKMFPLGGGGMTSSPPPGPDGEGVYPHSYERLGVQQGWHSTVVLFDPTPATTQPRDVTLQVFCTRRKPGKVKHPSPHKIRRASPGETETAVAKCKGRSQLFGGGFQRMYFDNRGGVFVTESRAISSKAWRVTGRGFGQFGAQMVAIAYCVKGKKPRLTEVSSSTPLGIGRFGTATTAACPPGQPLTVGGFSSSPSGSTLVTNGAFNADGSWSTSGFNRFGPAANVTTHGYCLRS